MVAGFISQIDVTEHTRLRQSYIADIEAGKKTGSAGSLRAIAAALAAPLDRHRRMTLRRPQTQA